MSIFPSISAGQDSANHTPAQKSVKNFMTPASKGAEIKTLFRNKTANV